MPAYNAAPFIRKSIESILDQTYQNFEFIIVNDGSSDNTETIVEAFQDFRIRYFRNAKNEGLVPALNFGLSQCKGEFIARMDADDWAYPNRLKIQVDHLLRNTDIDLCGGNIAIWDGKKTVKKWVFPNNDEDIKANLFLKCSIAHPTAMFRRTLLEAIDGPYQEEHFPAEDYALWVRLMDRKKFYNVNKILLKYRINPNQISNRKSQEQKEKAFNISWEQVRALKIKKEILVSYKNVHWSFVIGPWPSKKNELVALINWLQILKNANEKQETYETFSLNLILAKKLWDICYFLSSKKFNSYRLFSRSGFKAFYSPSLYHELICAIKNF